MDRASNAAGPAALRMEGRGSPEGCLVPSMPLRRRRQQRTVYSVEQREELEKFFEGNHYPSYEEREALAASLSLQEHQVQVWFKNRRAKQTRLRGRTRERGRGAGVSSQSPRACAPAPAPVGPGIPEDPVLPSGPAFAEDPAFPWGPVFPEDLEFPGGSVFPQTPGFYSAPPPGPFGGGPAAEPSVSSNSQAWWDPAQGAQDLVPVAPAPALAVASVWPEDSNAEDFSPDLDFKELLSL